MKYVYKLTVEDKIDINGYDYVGYCPQIDEYVLVVTISWVIWYSRYYWISKDDYMCAKNNPDEFEKKYSEASKSAIGSPRGINFMGSQTLRDYYCTMDFKEFNKTNNCFEGYLYNDKYLYAHIVMNERHYAVLPYICEVDKEKNDSFFESKKIHWIYDEVGTEKKALFMGFEVEENNGENTNLTDKEQRRKAMEKNIEEKFIELKELYKDSPKLDFDWEQKNGLRYVSDESLELAYEILKNYKISIELKDEKIVIHTNLENLCDHKYTTEELIKTIKEDSKTVEKNKEINFTTDKDLTVNRMCYQCKFQRCPKHLAGYIFYLINKNLLEEKLADRKKYREENEVNEYYAFEWKYGNILKIISDEMYEFCYQVAKENLIYVRRFLQDNETMIKIDSAIKCTEYKLLYGNLEKLKNTIKPKENWLTLTRNPNTEIKLCNSYDCSLRGCPFAIAGIIKYLINSGKEEVLNKERQYYQEHQEEMNKELDQMIENREEIIEEKINSSLENLKEYEKQIDNFGDLINSLTNKNQNSFHCIIEGDDIEERRKFVDNIVEFLYNDREISSKILKLSLQNLTASNVYATNKIEAEGDDPKGVKRAADSLIKYTILYENKIYILDGIKEFIDDYKNFIQIRNDFLWGEIRKKQFNHVIQLLTDLSQSNYIILEGTSHEIEEFLSLDIRIQYIYQNSIFKLPEFSIDEAFSLYTKTLNNTIFKKLKKNEEEYKEKFIEYVSLNKNGIPFSKRELASYLAMYSNSKGDVVFPDNIYKKETVDEALKNIIGLEKVKEKVKEFEKYMMYKIKAEAHGIKLSATNMHMIFTGNPGTGKTTIARIMAKMLYDMGIIKENKLIEVERKDLVGSYIGHTAPKTSEVISKAMGGVLFIDEAYTLAGSNSNDFAKEAIATLIKAMEDHKDNLVVIFAGYKKEMKDFLDINPGIASRIGYTFDFEDYSVDELMKIFYKKMENMGFSCTEKCDVEIKRVCTYFSQRKNFGNGRFIDKLIQETILKHAINDNKNVKQINENDIPTIQEINNTNEPEETTDELLSNVIGLEKIKEKIKKFENYVKFIKKAEKNNISVPNQNMHMIFTGNPGTGKTTIARIMAKILYNAGIIQENKLVEVERKDLIGEHVGQTAPKTYDVIEKAMGGILFIDEAYSLASKKGLRDSFGEEAIATLIKAMEDHKGEFIVIFAGYKNEMAEFINMNSGITSRIGYTFDFPDYNVEELLEIFYKKIEKAGFKCNKECNMPLKNICTYFSSRKNFGNGRFVDKLIQEVIIKHAENGNKNINEIIEIDIPTIKELNNTIEPEETTDELLENIIGLDNLKLKIKEFEDYVKFIKEAEKNNISVPNQNMHMIFTGNPGTGKTTIARIMAKILFNAGMIQENKLVEVERKDLIAGYIGQTAPKTYEVIEKAMGGILFIDEAYSLTQKTGAHDRFGEEAIATLIKAMEDHKGEFIVIFAGYKKEMAEFINMNSGISSRIGYVFDFPDYSREELSEILYKKIRRHNLEIDEQAKDKVFEIMNYFCNVENIGNGRFSDKVFQEILIKHAKNKDKDIQIIKENDIPTIKEMTTSLFNGDRMINPDIISSESLKRTAIHEIGHAFVRYKLFENPGILKITINPEGRGTLGYVRYKTQEGTYTNGKKYWLNRIKGLLAGMASEEIFTGEFENGNTSDLEMATNIARNMVTRWGMSDLGFGQIDDANGPMAIKIQEEINSILAECYEETKMIIKQNRSSMVKVIKFLLKKKEITEEEFFEIIGDVK